MRFLRVGVKLLLFGILTLTLMPVQVVLLAIGAEHAARRTSGRYHRILAALFGIRTTVKGAPGPAPLIVLANHASWIDVIAIAGIVPVAFVAKREVSSWPLIGMLARLQRSVFVDRGHYREVTAARRDITSRIGQGYVVVIFPEGTSTDGTVVLPFRSALIESARDVLELDNATRVVWIQPLAITYVGRGEHLATWERDDPTPFFRHLLRFLASEGVSVLMRWGDPMAFVTASDRKVVGRAAELATRRLLETLRHEPAGHDG